MMNRALAPLRWIKRDSCLLGTISGNAYDQLHNFTAGCSETATSSATVTGCKRSIAAKSVQFAAKALPLQPPKLERHRRETFNSVPHICLLLWHRQPFTARKSGLEEMGWQFTCKTDGVGQEEDLWGQAISPRLTVDCALRTHWLLMLGCHGVGLLVSRKLASEFGRRTDDLIRIAWHTQK